MPNFDDIDLTDVIMDGDPYGEFEDPGGGGGESGSSPILLGTCTTAAATAAKVVTLTDVTDFELTKGTVIVVKFTNTNTAQNPTLNVNNTGAKSIYYNTSVLTTGSLGAAGTANRYIEYMYDGTNWVWISQGVDNNTTYSAMSKSELTTGTATTSRVVRADYLHNGIKQIAESAKIDTANNTATFTSSDTTDASATSWTSVTKLASGESHTSIFAKMSQMFKNIRYLYKMLGTTDISSIGDGTVTGGLDTLNSDLNVVTTTTFTNSTWLNGSKSTLHRLGKLRILHIYPKSGVVLSQAVVITLGTADIPSQDVSMDNMGLDGNRGRVGIQASTGYVYLFGSGTVNNAVYSIIYVVD